MTENNDSNEVEFRSSYISRPSHIEVVSPITVHGVVSAKPEFEL